MTVLTHYCSTAAFHAIIESRSIRLSALSLSNDTLEGKLVAGTLAHLADEERLQDYEKRQTLGALRVVEEFFDGLGFCLSANGDLLSQWRAYADDGRGFAIGFSTDYLSWRTEQETASDHPKMTLVEVEYDPEAQREAVRPMYATIRQVRQKLRPLEMQRQSLLAARSPEEEEETKKAILRLRFELLNHALSLLPHLHRLKHTAFREEQERRILSLCTRSGDKSCSYHPRQDRLVPYKTVTLVELGRKPIVSVVIGPRNLSSESAVAGFLERSGFEDVTVERSSAPYR